MDPRPALLAIAAAASVGAANAQDEKYPPHAPFAKWHAETTREQQLDRLITEVVTAFERGDPGAPFAEWEGRDIQSDYRALHLQVPETSSAFFTGRNFLFRNQKLGTFFYARLDQSPMTFFVPSACRERATRGKRIDDTRINVEGMPDFQSHYPYTESDRQALMREVAVPFHEMACGEGIMLRLYDGYLLKYFHDAERRRNPDAAGNAIEHSWVGIAIVRPPSPAP